MIFNGIPRICNNIYNLYESIDFCVRISRERRGRKRGEEKKRWRSSYTRKRVVQQGRSVTIDYLCRWRRPATVKLKAGIGGLLHIGRYTRRFHILSFHGAKWAVIVRNVGDIFFIVRSPIESRKALHHMATFSIERNNIYMDVQDYINRNMEKKNTIFFLNNFFCTIYTLIRFLMNE